MSWLKISLLCAAATALCVPFLLVAIRYFRATKRGTHEHAEASFEKDVEWQLQSEFQHAIHDAPFKHALAPAPPTSTSEATPLLTHTTISYSPRPAKAARATRVAFADPPTEPGSRRHLRDFATRATRSALPPLLPKPQESLTNGHLTPPLRQEDMLHEEPDVHINPKQFHRILKRRMTRNLIEDYFRSRTHGVSAAKATKAGSVDIGSERFSRSAARHAVVVV